MRTENATRAVKPMRMNHSPYDAGTRLSEQEMSLRHHHGSNAGSYCAICEVLAQSSELHGSEGNVPLLTLAPPWTQRRTKTTRATMR